MKKLLKLPKLLKIDLGAYEKPFYFTLNWVMVFRKREGFACFFLIIICWEGYLWVSIAQLKGGLRLVNLVHVQPLRSRKSAIRAFVFLHHLLIINPSFSTLFSRRRFFYSSSITKLIMIEIFISMILTLSLFLVWLFTILPDSLIILTDIFRDITGPGSARFRDLRLPI